MPVRAWRFKSSHPHSEDASRSLLLAAVAAAVVFSGDGLGARGAGPTTEVVVTLKAPPLSTFGRSLQSALARRLCPRGCRRPRARSCAASGRRCPPRRCAGATTSSPTGSRSSSRARSSAHSPACPASTRSGRTSATTRSATRPAPRADRRRQALGPAFATAGNGMKIGIIDDGLHATHPYFDPSRLRLPARLPEGPDGVHDAEGDRAAHVRAALADLQVRERAVRPDEPRSTRRTSPGSRPATTARCRPARRSPASHRTRTSATTRR